MAEDEKVEATDPKAEDEATDGKKLKDPQLKKVVGGLSAPTRDAGADLGAVRTVKPPIAHK